MAFISMQKKLFKAVSWNDLKRKLMIKNLTIWLTYDPWSSYFLELNLTTASKY